MTIDGVSGRTSYLGSSILNIKNQLKTLSQQISSGKKATTYAGLGVDAGTAQTVAADALELPASAPEINPRVVDAPGEVSRRDPGSPPAVTVAA